MKEVFVNKLKILRNPRKKSGKQLVKDLVKPGYEVSMEQKGDVIVRIDKKNVPMSLNGKKGSCPSFLTEAMKSEKEVVEWVKWRWGDNMNFGFDYDHNSNDIMFNSH